MVTAEFTGGVATLPHRHVEFNMNGNDDSQERTCQGPCLPPLGENPVPSGSKPSLPRTGPQNMRLSVISVTTDATCDSSWESDFSETRDKNEPNKPILAGIVSTSVSFPSDRSPKSVTFSTIEIRNYPVTLGDNPSCHYGAPIGLDWCYDQLPVLSLDDFENIRMSRRRFKPYQLVQGTIRRKELLASAGITREARKVCEREVARIQWQRSVTSYLMPLRHVETCLESALRKIKRLFKKGG